jgi:hypothetical protein
MSKNSLPVTVTIPGSVMFNFLPDRTPKRELWVRPTENNFAKLTPFFVWFCRYLSLGSGEIRILD